MTDRTIQVNQNELKKLINIMLSNYSFIEYLLIQQNDASKKTIYVKATISVFEHNLSKVDLSCVHDKIKTDLDAFSEWLKDVLNILLNGGNKDDIKSNIFNCYYKRPQSGFDCVYLSYEDYENDLQPYLNLFDVSY